MDQMHFNLLAQIACPQLLLPERAFPAHHQGQQAAKRPVRGESSLGAQWFPGQVQPVSPCCALNNSQQFCSGPATYGHEGPAKINAG